MKKYLMSLLAIIFACTAIIAKVPAHKKKQNSKFINAPRINVPKEHVAVSSTIL